MDKLLRRAAGSLVLFSYLLPWLKLKRPFAPDLLGITLLKHFFRVGPQIRSFELSILAFLAFCLLFCSIVILFVPRTIPTILLTIISMTYVTTLLVMKNVVLIKFSGFTILSFSISLLIFSFFLNENHSTLKNDPNSIPSKRPSHKFFIDVHSTETKVCHQCQQELLKYQTICPFCEDRSSIEKKNI